VHKRGRGFVRGSERLRFPSTWQEALRREGAEGRATSRTEGRGAVAKPRGPRRVGIQYTRALRGRLRVEVGVRRATGDPLIIDVAQSTRDDMGIGASVWDCGLAMARLLRRLVEFSDSAPWANPKAPRPSASTLLPLRVLELGSGTGIVGLAAAALLSQGVRSFEVHLTDVEPTLALTRSNVRREGARLDLGPLAGTDDTAVRGHVRAQRLDWSAALLHGCRTEADCAPPYDVVLCSDCLYDASLTPAFVATLLAATSERSVVYVAYFERRAHDTQRYFSALEKHFEVRVCSTTACGFEGREAPETISVVHICRCLRRLARPGE
jgi:predicted nicotinamide N-methyase